MSKNPFLVPCHKPSGKKLTIKTDAWSKKTQEFAQGIYNRGMKAKDVVGFGGRYGTLKDTLSQEDVIESDHFPPESVYASAKDERIKAIHPKDMGAVTLLKNDHKFFITTGSHAWGQQQVKLQKDLFGEGRYYEAIKMNLDWYKTNPDPKQLDTERVGFLDSIKKGVADTLYIHVANGLITEEQRNDLVKEYGLSASPVPDDPFQSAIRQKLLQDTMNYMRHKKDENQRRCRRSRWSFSDMSNALANAMSHRQNHDQSAPPQGDEHDADKNKKEEGDKENNPPVQNSPPTNNNQQHSNNNGGGGTKILKRRFPCSSDGAPDSKRLKKDSTKSGFSHQKQIRAAPF